MGLGLGLGLATSPTRPPGAIAPSVRGTPTTGTSANPVLPTCVAGDVLVVGTIFSSGAIPTATGWTRSIGQIDGSSSVKLCVFTKVSDGTETLLNPSSSPAGYVAYAVKNVSAVDVTGSNSGINATPVCPSVSPTGANDLLIDFIGVAGDSSTITMPSGETQSANVAGIVRGGSKSLSASGATGTRSGSLDAPDGWATGTVTAKA
jgi:hypothetical protein